MSLEQYFDQADYAVGGRRALKRASTILGAVTNPTPAIVAPHKNVFSRFLDDVNAARPEDVPDGLGTVAGAGLGYYMYKGKHPVLGIIGGASLGRNLPALLSPGYRTLAMRNLATTGAGVAGSLYMKKHPVVGFIAGALAGGVASHLMGLK